MALVGQFEPQACLGDTPRLLHPTPIPPSEFSRCSLWRSSLPHIRGTFLGAGKWGHGGRLVSERVSFLASYIIPTPLQPLPSLVCESSRFLKMANDLLTISVTHCKLPKQQP